MNWAKIKTWALVGLGVVALFLLGQWQRARDLVKRTKEDLARQTALAQQQAEAAKRERELKRERDEIHAAREAKMAAIEVKRRQDLDAADKARKELDVAAKDPDAMVELGNKLRREGKLD